MKKTLLTLLSVASATFTLLAQDTAPDKSASDAVKGYVKRGQVELSKENKTTSLSAQNKFLGQLSLNVGLTTMGFSVEAVTPLSASFKLRGGIDLMPALYTREDIIEVKDGKLRDAIVGNLYPDYVVSLQPELFNAHLLVDYYPSASSLFHFVGGVFVGASNIEAKGSLVDPITGEPVRLRPGEEWPTLNVEGYDLNIDNGQLDATIRMGKTIKPYLGIGFGHVLPQNKLSFNVDLGAVYQGSYSIRQYGKSVSSNEYTSSALSIDKYTKLVKIWPVIGFQIAYRLY